MSDIRFSLQNAPYTNATRVEGTEDCLRLSATWQGARVQIAGEPGMLSGKRYLVFDLEFRCEQSVCAIFDFWAKDTPDSEESDLWVKVGILPNVKTRVVFPLERLDSQSMFIDPTPGRLKMVVFGKPVNPDDIDRFTIGTIRTQMPYEYTLSNVYATNTEPEYLLPEDDKRVDEMGQYIPKQWEGKYDSAETMCADLRALYEEAKGAPDRFADPDWDEYGGYAPLSFEATGYFRSEKKDGRWWLVTPAGHAFFSNGVDCVGLAAGRTTGLEPYFTWLPEKDDPLYGECWEHSRGIDLYDFFKSNLIRAFGKEWFVPWATIVKYRMKAWGLNTIGNWSDKAFIDWSGLPYVWPLRDFPETKTAIFRDFPDVFDDEYRENSKIFAKQLEEFAGDKNMIGYFMRNEPTWAFVEGVCIAEEMLANPGRFTSKDIFISVMREKYAHIAAFNAAWNVEFDSFDDLRKPMTKAKGLSPTAAEDLENFSYTMYKAYNSIPAIACKAVDPHHMNLGMRYGYISQPGVVAGWEHLDVFSINSYFVSPYDQTQQACEYMDLPVMVGEYHFGSLEGGLTATGLRAVAKQRDRADAYRYFLEQGAAHPHFVGAHYFTLYDQAALGRFDGENYQIGMVDVAQRPYRDFTDCLAQCHSAAYAVAAGKAEPWDKSATDIPKVAY